MMKQIMKHLYKIVGKHLHAADSTENAKKNMPWQGGQKFSD